MSVFGVFQEVYLQRVAQHTSQPARLRTVPALRFNGERKVTICPECGKYLSPGEVAEQWCEDCGALTPREARAI